jgi:hypothetical protein
MRMFSLESSITSKIGMSIKDDAVWVSTVGRNEILEVGRKDSSSTDRFAALTSQNHGIKHKLIISVFRIFIKISG